MMPIMDRMHVTIHILQTTNKLLLKIHIYSNLNHFSQNLNKCWATFFKKHNSERFMQEYKDDYHIWY